MPLCENKHVSPFLQLQLTENTSVAQDAKILLLHRCYKAL